MPPDRGTCGPAGGRHAAREGRDGTKWDIVLPKQCWQCASRDKLMQREYEHSLRGFESPIAILVCTGSVALLLLVLAMWMKSGLSSSIRRSTAPGRVTATRSSG